MPHKIVVSFDNLTLGYQRHPAIHHLSGNIQKGSLLAITGSNGAGKSTLLKAIAGLIKPLDGKIFIDPQETIAYLPQQIEFDREFPLSVYDLVSLGLRLKFFHFLKKDQKEKISIALKRVGLQGFENRMINSLSGGQLQRALFARLIVLEKNLILLDEPFTAIDQQSEEILIDLIQEWHCQGKTILTILHDFRMIHQYFPETLLLAREKICWDQTEKCLQSDFLQKARLRSEAWDETSPFCQRKE